MKVKALGQFASSPSESPFEGLRTALVLEGEPLVLAVFRAVLQRSGFRVLSNATAEAAIHYSDDRTLRIDLIIADIMLPGASGTDAVLQIRTTRPDVPVIFTSCTPPDWWTPLDRRNVAELPKGSYSFRQKPFAAAQMMKSGEELLDRMRSCKRSEWGRSLEVRTSVGRSA